MVVATTMGRQDTHFFCLDVLDQLTDVAIGLGQWSQALTYGQRALVALQTVLRCSPLHCRSADAVLGLQCFRVGKLAHHMEDLVCAVRYFQQALDHLEVTHGPCHPLVAELSGCLVEAQTEQRHRAYSLQSLEEP